MARVDGRANDELRPTTISLDYQSFAEGSALIEVGKTKVMCSASIEERVPGWLRGEGKGWVTAEYAMLPRSTLSRTARESAGGGVRGRNQEIQRLIGRSLRAVTDLAALGDRTVVVDCDVLQADGGTRTAAITGAYAALYHALQGLVSRRVLHRVPLRTAVGAVSVGLVDGELLLDLCYAEDFKAHVDFNIAMTREGDLVEIQASGEDGPFKRALVEEATCLAHDGISALLDIQSKALRAEKSF